MFGLTLSISQSRRLQAALDLDGFHERLPNTPASIVLDHDQDRPLVDAQHLRVPPAGGQIERVAETVPCPDVRTIQIVEVAQRRDADSWRERKGAARSRGCDGAIVDLGRRRATSRVGLKLAEARAVAGGQSPNQFAVALELPRIRNTIGALCQRRAARI